MYIIHAVHSHSTIFNENTKHKFNTYIMIVSNHSRVLKHNLINIKKSDLKNIFDMKHKSIFKAFED